MALDDKLLGDKQRVGQSCQVAVLFGKNAGFQGSTLSGHRMTTGFGLFELPTCGLLQKEWDNSPPKTELVPVHLLPFAYSRFAYFRPKSGVLPTHKKIIFGHQSDVKLHLEVGKCIWPMS